MHGSRGSEGDLIEIFPEIFGHEAKCAEVGGKDVVIAGVTIVGIGSKALKRFGIRIYVLSNLDLDTFRLGSKVAF